MKETTRIYVKTHSDRYEISLSRLSKYLNGNDRILSLGSDGQFEDLIKVSNPGVSVSFSNWDLRFPFIHATSLFDLVICLEVIEHLKDRNDEYEDFTSYTHSGIFNLLIEANRSLKDGGLLVITTPNLSSWKSILKLIRGQDPYLYWPHVHEFAPYELSYFLAKSGFEIAEFSSFDAYPTDLFLGKVRSRILHLVSRLLKSEKSIFHLRRSTLFLVARKVAQPEEILAWTDWWAIKTSDLSKSKPQQI
jgi:SAM-dependent methyltransferase